MGMKTMVATQPMTYGRYSLKANDRIELDERHAKVFELAGKMREENAGTAPAAKTARGGKYNTRRMTAAHSEAAPVQPATKPPVPTESAEQAVVTAEQPAVTAPAVSSAAPPTVKK